MRLTLLKVVPHETRTVSSLRTTIELYLGLPKPMFVNLGCKTGGVTLIIVLFYGCIVG
jgi:hypothetical protein